MKLFNPTFLFRFSLSQTSKFFRKIGVPRNSQRFISLHKRLLFRKELFVPTFCNITIDVPFSVNLEPLDVHKYPSCDKIFIELNNSDENENREPLFCHQEGNDIYIKEAMLKELCPEDLTCTVVAPIKANLNVLSKHGNIEIKHFNGEKITVASDSGNISVNGYQGREIDVRTSTGNVKFGGVVQSSLIDIFISERGSVFVNKLLGEKTNISTKYGNILVNSSFCKKSRFIVEKGDMNLKNVHKHCEVHNKMSGNINISSMDGQLKLTQADGNADIHLSRVTENSEINILNGHLLLRLSEECQESTCFNIESKTLNFKDNVNVKQLQPDAAIDEYKTVQVNCKNCSVDIEAGSWFNMNFPKNSDFA